MVNKSDQLPLLAEAEPPAAVGAMTRIFDGEFFEIIRREGNVLLVRCHTCGPEGVPLRSSPKSNGNILKHIKRRHPELLEHIRESKGIKCRASAVASNAGEHLSSKREAADAPPANTAGRRRQPSTASRTASVVNDRHSGMEVLYLASTAADDATTTTTDVGVTDADEANEDDEDGDDDGADESQAAEQPETKYAAHIMVHMHPTTRSTAEDVSGQRPVDQPSLETLSAAIDQHCVNVQYVPAVSVPSSSSVAAAAAAHQPSHFRRPAPEPITSHGPHKRARLMSSGGDVETLYLNEDHDNDDIADDDDDVHDDDEQEDAIDNNAEQHDDDGDAHVDCSHETITNETVHHITVTNGPPAAAAANAHHHTSTHPAMHHQHHPANNDGELLALRRQLMQREFELVQQQHAARMEQQLQRHQLQMEMLRAELAFKRREHEAAMRQLSRGDRH